MQYMKHTIDTASATAVSTSGRSEWTSNFCSVRASNRIIRQLSGPRFMSNSRKPAPLKCKSKQPIKTSTCVIGHKDRKLATVCLPWPHWTKALVWFDDVDVSAFHSCVVVDLLQSLSEWHLLLSTCVLVRHHENVGA